MEALSDKIKEFLGSGYGSGSGYGYGSGYGGAIIKQLAERIGKK